MGAFADSLFTLLLGWVRGLVSAIMTLFSSGGKNGLIPFLGKNWLLIVLVILAVGLAVDWFIWMLRWQPYRVWGTKMRRIARALHLRPQDDETADEPEAADEPDEEETGESPYAPPAYSEQDEMSGTRLYQRPTQTEQPAQENIDFAQDDALDLPPLTQEDEAQAYAAAQQEDEAQDYPGMYYDQSMYMRPAQEDRLEEAGAQEEMLDDAQIDHGLQPEADEFDDPDWTEGENDVEWAQEIDPLALYDDPQTLSQLEQPEPIAEVIQTPSEEAAPSQGQPRRRRRRRLEAE